MLMGLKSSLTCMLPVHACMQTCWCDLKPTHMHVPRYFCMLACGLVLSLSTSRSDGYYDWFTSSNGYVNFDDVAQGEDREFLVVGASYY